LKNKLKWLAFGFACFCLCFLFYPPVTTAYDLLDSDSTAITATVPDREKPTPPVLIQPENGQLLNISKPKFVWTGSSDNVGIDYYEVWVDGSILSNKIEPSTGLNNTFNYTPTTNLADGQRSWQVKAVDTAGNYAFSATWLFSLDTLSPELIIKKIDQNQTEIKSSQNQVFNQTYTVQNVTPLLQGTGEAGSQVSLYLTAGGQETTVLNFIINQNGSWEVRSPGLKEGVLTYLTFITKDPAGNVSVIERVPVQFVTQPTTSSLPPIISWLLPDKTKISPTPAILITPTIAPSSTTTTITKPDQINLLLMAMPKTVSRIITRSTPTGLSLFAVPIWIMISIALGLFYFFVRLGIWPDLNKMKELLWLLGWWPSSQEKGRVFNPDENTPFGLAELTVLQINQNAWYQIDKFFSNKNGEYLLPKIPSGQFMLNVLHPQGFFPCLKPRESDSTWQNYYLKERFVTKQASLLPIVGVPMTGIKNQNSTHTPLLVSIGSWHGVLGLPLNLFICLVLVFLFPHPINFISSIIISAYSVKKSI